MESGLTNVASVTSTTPDPDATNDEVSVTTPVTTRADLDVTKLARTRRRQAAGEATLTYTLTVANLGLSDAQAVTLSDTMPAGTAFVSATGDPAKPCSAVATTVTCTSAPGASQAILVTVRLSTSLPPQR